MTKLDRTWKNCLRMWKWVSGKWEPERSVENMKREWLEKNGFTRDVMKQCFFCDYAFGKASPTNDPGDFGLGETLCISRCPGRMISVDFECTHAEYCYDHDPKAFYAKLLELDAKRKSTN